LSKIIIECKAWLRKKRTKKGTPTQAETDHFARRYNAIKALADDALRVLFGIDPDLQAAYTRYNTVRDVISGGGLGTSTMTKKAMATGYLTERTCYLDFNKRTAISASIIPDLVEGNSFKEGATNKQKRAMS